MLTVWVSFKEECLWTTSLKHVVVIEQCNKCDDDSNLHTQSNGNHVNLFYKSVMVSSHF